MGIHLEKTTNTCYSPALAHRVSLTEEVLPGLWAPRILPSSTPGTAPLVSISLPFLKHTKLEPTSGPSPLAWSMLPHPTAQRPHVCPSPTSVRSYLKYHLLSEPFPGYQTSCHHPVVFLSMSCIKIRYATHLFSCLLSSLLSLPPLPPSPRHTLEYIPVRSGNFVFLSPVPRIVSGTL